MKTKYILSGALLSLLAASCTDLDVDIKSTYTEFPGSEIAFESKTADAYFAFRGALGRRFDEGNSCNSDEYTAISFGGDYLNGRDMANFSLHTISPSASDAQLGVYSELTSGITKCNQLLYVDLADLGLHVLLVLRLPDGLSLSCWPFVTNVLHLLLRMLLPMASQPVGWLTLFLLSCISTGQFM